MPANLLKIRIGSRYGKAGSVKDSWIPVSYRDTRSMAQTSGDVLLFELYIDKWQPSNHPTANNNPGVIDQVIVQCKGPAKVQNYSAECVWSVSGPLVKSGEFVKGGCCNGVREYLQARILRFTGEQPWRLSKACSKCPWYELVCAQSRKLHEICESYSIL